MPYYLFIEDDKGKLGYNGKEFFSMAAADSEAEDVPGITHIIEADNLEEAKRKLRGALVRRKRDMGMLYRNVRNKVGV